MEWNRRWGLGIGLVVIAFVGFEASSERKHLKDSIDGAEAAAEEAERKVKDLEEKVDELESEVDELKSRLDDVEDKDGDDGLRPASQRMKRTGSAIGKARGTLPFDPNAYLGSPATGALPEKAGETSLPAGFVPGITPPLQNPPGAIKVVPGDLRARVDKKLVEWVVVGKPTPRRNARADKKLVESVVENKTPPQHSGN